MAGIDKVLGLVGGTVRRRRRRLPRHHRGDQPAARGQGRRARATSPTPATRRCSRSPGSRCPTATATPTSGSSRPASCRATWCAASRARLDYTGAELRPFDEDGARAVARWFREQGIDTLGVCFLHAYANPAHEERMRAILREEHPDAVVSLSSEVLREYREYERAMTTLVDAAVKPRLSRYVNNIKDRLDRAQRPGRPVLRDEVQRRRAVGRRGRAPADHHGALRSGGGCARRRADREGRRLRQGADQRRRRHLDRRLGRHRRRADPDHRGQRRRLPVQDPDDRRRHRRRRRRLDRLALAGGHAQGRPAVGRRRPRTALLRQGRHATSRSPTPTSSSAGSRRTCSAARSRSTSTPPARASRRWPRTSA